MERNKEKEKNYENMKEKKFGNLDDYTYFWSITEITSKICWNKQILLIQYWNQKEKKK